MCLNNNNINMIMIDWFKIAEMGWSTLLHLVRLVAWTEVLSVTFKGISCIVLGRPMLISWTGWSGETGGKGVAETAVQLKCWSWLSEGLICTSRRMQESKRVTAEYYFVAVLSDQHEEISDLNSDSFTCWVMVWQQWAWLKERPHHRLSGCMMCCS